MRLIIKTNSKTSYFVQLPNHIDLGNVDLILKEAIEKLPKGAEYKSSLLHGDELCDEERKQLDWYGEIKYPLMPLNVNIYSKEYH